MISGHVERSFAVVDAHGASRNANSFSDDVRCAHELVDCVTPYGDTCHSVFVCYQHVHASRRALLWRVHHNDDARQPYFLLTICSVFE